MRTRSRSREEKSLGVDVETLLAQCEKELGELREELEAEKRIVRELRDSSASAAVPVVTEPGVSREDHERVERIASDLRETCRVLALENKDLREKHASEVAERERLVGVVSSRDSDLKRERLEWTKTRDDIAANVRTLCKSLEQQKAQTKRMEEELSKTKLTLQQKNQELVASYGEYAKIDNARATLNIRLQELMHHNSQLTALMFQNQQRG